MAASWSLPGEHPKCGACPPSTVVVCPALECSNAAASTAKQEQAGAHASLPLRSAARRNLQIATSSSSGGADPSKTLIQWGWGKPRGDEVGGGLNNMIMNVAQLVNDVCPGGKRPVATLVLPNLTSGWRFFRPGEAGRQITRPLLFGEVFDAPHFVASIRPCVAIELSDFEAMRRRSGGLARAGLAVLSAHLEPINANYKYGHLLPFIYRALRPSATVGAVVAGHVGYAAAHSGARWAAVHLRIERDWWVQSGFCGRRGARRCIPPDEVAAVTAAARAASNATGAVLFYAADNLAPSGPRVRPGAFGAATVRLPNAAASTAYTVRAAAELFAAAAAPAGFYGNSFSTFSRGVAMLRWAAANRTAGAAPLRSRAGRETTLGRGASGGGGAAAAGGGGGTQAQGRVASYAYDCAKHLATAKERREMSLGVLLLRTVDKQRCSFETSKAAGGKGKGKGAGGWRGFGRRLLGVLSQH